MVAIELLRLKHRIIPQQRIGKYKIDFVLPDTKTAIEVDGCLFHSGIDAEREYKIQATLGFRWRIIHVPAELIRKDIRKLKELLEDH
jgi:very-short-patch-repair endonuclease